MKREHYISNQKLTNFKLIQMFYNTDIPLSKKDSNDIFAKYIDYQVKEEVDASPEFKFDMVESQEENDSYQFYLFNQDESLFSTDNYEFDSSAKLATTEQEKDLHDEMQSPSITREPSSPSSSAGSYIQVKFNGQNPNMDDFLFKIQEEIEMKGINEMVCEALDIKNEDDMLFNTASEIIKVKKRKTKGQIKQLEEEFAKNDDWDKEFMNKLALKLGLEAAQVYKWHWDQISKKLGKAPKRTVKAQKALKDGKRKKTTSTRKAKRTKRV